MSEQEQGPTEEQLEQAHRVERHRHPRYTAFVGTGAVLGLLVALVLSFSVEPPAGYGRGALVGYLGMLLVVVGALAGGLVAVLGQATSRTSRSSSGRKPTRGK